MMLGLLLLAAPAVLQSAQPVTADSTAAKLRGGELRRNAISQTGMPGMVLVPVAAALPSGMADLSYDNARMPSAVSSVGFQRNVFMTFGFLSRFTVGARGTVAGDSIGFDRTRDLSANLQVQLLSERGWRPALAAGAIDEGGAAAHFEARYFVASKTLPGRARLSIGYGTGAALLDGVFGGADVAIGEWASAAAEFDGRTYNAGVHVYPFPTVADRFGLQPRFDVTWKQGVGVATGVGIRTPLGTWDGRDRRRQPVSSLPASGSYAPTSAQHAPAGSEARAAEADLVSYGLENVRVAVDSGAVRTMDVQYENRRFNRDEMDALGIVMGVALNRAPAGVTRMRVTVRRLDIPVLTLECDIDGLIAFLDNRMSAEAFDDALSIRIPPSAGTAGESHPVNPSRWKLDLFVRPRIETTALTEMGVLDARVTLQPDVYLQLGSGMVLNARRAVEVSRTHGYPIGLDDPNADRLLMHKAFAVGPAARRGMPGMLAQFSAGLFGHNEVGVSSETDVPLADGRVSLGTTLGVVGRTFTNLDRAIALANIRVRAPSLDATASLTAGRFRNGDAGVAGELSRFFGATELAFYLRTTEFQSVAGLRLSLPLTPTRELKPARVRLRLPDVHRQFTQSTVFAPANALRRDVGLPLTTDHELVRSYRDRDRLQPVTIRSHLERLRSVVRRGLTSGVSRN